MREPTARELLDLMKGPNPVYSGNYHKGADVLAFRVEAVLDYCDEGFHECIVEHLKEIKRLLNGENV